LAGLGFEDSPNAVSPLIRALEDPETQVRVASVEALAFIRRGVAKSRSGGGIIRDAATGLIRCLKDPEPRVRTAATVAGDDVIDRKRDRRVTLLRHLAILAQIARSLAHHPGQEFRCRRDSPAFRSQVGRLADQSG
jgi:HEAT repeat protein